MHRSVYRSRRAVLRTAGGVMGSALSGSFLLACSGNSSKPASTATRAAAVAGAATPASAGSSAAATRAATGAPATGAAATPAAVAKTLAELKMGAVGLPPTMDPQEAVSLVAIRANTMIFDALLRRDFLNQSKIIPSLAASFQRVDDRTLDVTLRTDVTWQDGSPFTAADVKYTFDRILAKDPKLGVANANYFPLASVDVTGTNTVRFTATSTDAALENRLAYEGSQIIPAKYHLQVGADAFRLKPLGTGPFRVSEYATDDHITFDAYPGYFGGASSVKRVTMRSIPEVSTRTNALLSGDVDLISDVTPDQVQALNGKSNLTTKTVATANMYLLVYNMNAKPMDNPLVRQALSLAIDRQQLTSVLWNGLAVWTRGYQFEGEAYYDPTRPQTAFDPVKAKALLSQAGYGGEQITYLVISPNYYTNEQESAEAILQMWKQVGVNGKIAALEIALHTGEFRKPDSAYHVSTLSSASNGDPSSYLMDGAIGPGGLLQTSGWFNKTAAAAYDDLATQVQSTTDPAKRATTVKSMLDEYEKTAPETTLYIPKAIYSWRKVFDWTPYPLPYLDLRNYNFKVL